MFRLTREVRFGIGADGSAASTPAPNGHAGNPPLVGLGHFFALRLTLAGELDPVSSYLLNIKQIDQVAREKGLPLMAGAIAGKTFGGGGGVAKALFEALRMGWGAIGLDRLELLLSPYLSWSVVAREADMVRLSQKFEFSASHRLWNPALDEARNRELFGKCSNPHGHGHNYELQVTLKGEPDAKGVLVEVPRVEQIVAEVILERFDHKNLNEELPEFRETIPSVENIAATIYRLLKPRFVKMSGQLASVTVWETPKTWCEYSE